MSGQRAPSIPLVIRPVWLFGYNFEMHFGLARASFQLSLTKTPTPQNTPLAVRRLTSLGLLLLAMLVGGCGRPPGVPDSSADSQQKLPFDREPPSSGASPTQFLVPPNRIPEGTSLTVRLDQPISSASAHAGDVFDGSLDDAIMVVDQTLVPRGARVKGRVLDAKASSGSNDPGYLRIVLVSVDVHGGTIPVDSSSIFAKAPPHPEHSSSGGSPFLNDVAIIADRRLTFRLVHWVDVP